MKLYCLGPAKSYSDLVAQEIAKSQPSEILYLDSFEAIVEKIMEDEGAYGLVVIENSITSSIHPTVDALYANRIDIVDETYLNVRLHLLGNALAKLEEIKNVYSKKEALLQCQNFIREHKLKVTEVNSTAEGLNYLSKSTANAAIGGKQMLSKDYKILAENIGDQQVNKTRFLLIKQHGGELKPKQSANKLTAIITLQHKTGSLADVLVKIAEAKGNLSKIESRPIPGTEWEYRFWLDIEYDQKDQANLEQVIHENSLDYNFLGFYQKGDTLES